MNRTMEDLLTPGPSGGIWSPSPTAVNSSTGGARSNRLSLCAVWSRRDGAEADLSTRRRGREGMPGLPDPGSYADGGHSPEAVESVTSTRDQRSGSTSEKTCVAS